MDMLGDRFSFEAGTEFLGGPSGGFELFLRLCPEVCCHNERPRRVKLLSETGFGRLVWVVVDYSEPGIEINDIPKLPPVSNNSAQLSAITPPNL